MSVLTYSDKHLNTASTAKPARPSFWRRAYEAMVDSQQRRAEREVARYLASHGGLLTDDMEREIMQKVFASDWSLPQ